jgi:hypothetical protein
MRLFIATISSCFRSELIAERFQALPVDLEYFCAGDVNREEHG